MVLSDHLMCIIPHECIMLPRFHPTYKRIICRAQGGKKHEAIPVSHIYCKIEKRIHGEHKYHVIKMCNCVAIWWKVFGGNPCHRLSFIPNRRHDYSSSIFCPMLLKNNRAHTLLFLIFFLSHNAWEHFLFSISSFFSSSITVISFANYHVRHFLLT